MFTAAARPVLVPTLARMSAMRMLHTVAPREMLVEAFLIDEVCDALPSEVEAMALLVLAGVDPLSALQIVSVLAEAAVRP